MSANFKETVLFFSTKYKEYLIVILFAIFYRLLLKLFLFDEVIIANDSVSYLNLANKIADFNLIGYDGTRTPGYPILLLLAFNSVKTVVFYQHILGIITALLWYKTILNFRFSRKNSLWITLFLQFFLSLYFYESVILVESLCLFLISIVFYLISNDYINNKSFKVDIIMSFILGCLTLTKPFFVFIPFVIYGFIIIKNFNFKKIINPRISILLFSLISYLGWSYVNKINTGSFTSSTYMGFNIAQNCVYFAEKAPKEYKWIYEPYAKRRDLILKKDKNQSAAMAIWEIYTIGVYDYKKLSFTELSNELGKYAVETIKNNPKEYFRQVITKSWFDFWKSSIAVNKNDFKSNDNQFIVFYIIWFIQNKILVVFKLSFLLLVPFYIYKFLKNRVITNELIIVAIIFTTSILQGLITYGTNSRYGFPFEYLIILIVILFIRNTIKLPRFLSNYLQ